MRVLVPALFIVMVAFNALAQDTIPEHKPQKPKNPVSEKIFYGGTVGISFGDFSRIALYPYIGLSLSEKLRTGVQFGYEYISDKRALTTFTASNYGLSVFGQYNIIPSIYIHAEPAIYSYDAYYLLEKDRVWVPFFYVGAGLHQRLGSRSVVYIQVKFDLIQDSNSPYSDGAPFFDIGVGVGI